MTEETNMNSTVVDWTENEQDVEVNDADAIGEVIETAIPDELPILPLRGVVVYPHPRFEDVAQARTPLFPLITLEWKVESRASKPAR